MEVAASGATAGAVSFSGCSCLTLPAPFFPSTMVVSVVSVFVIVASQKANMEPEHVLGGGFKYFSFSSLLGEDSHFDEHIFQMGWFNHQLVFFFKLGSRGFF